VSCQINGKCSHAAGRESRTLPQEGDLSSTPVLGGKCWPKGAWSARLQQESWEGDDLYGGNFNSQLRN